MDTPPLLSAAEPAVAADAAAAAACPGAGAGRGVAAGAPSELPSLLLLEEADQRLGVGVGHGALTYKCMSEKNLHEDGDVFKAEVSQC